MTEVLHSPSSSSPSISSPPHNATLIHQTGPFIVGESISGNQEIELEDIRASEKRERERERRDQLSLLAIIVTLIRKGFWMACKTDRADFSSNSASDGDNCDSGSLEIGWPTDVQHVNHVTFDRFHGFLGLPVEFEPEVPRRAPSASATIFGVSTESMQLSYDPRGNSIPTILLLMQRHLYSQGGLQVEGIFRITAGNSQEVYVREQLNRGVVPEGVDVHCLAGLMKAWFRELPRGVLDFLSPEQVMQCQSEDDCDALAKLLPQTEAALLDWAINLMADVAQEEHVNKMNARNIAMVFAPNMTQMADPLIALVYAVQVMNFLKTLIEKTLRERGHSFTETASISHMEPSDDNGNQNSSWLHIRHLAEPIEESIEAFLGVDPGSEANPIEDITDEDYLSYSTSTEDSNESTSSETPPQVYTVSGTRESIVIDDLQNQFVASRKGQSSYSEQTKSESRIDGQQVVGVPIKADSRSKGISILRRINSISERFEARC